MLNAMFQNKTTYTNAFIGWQMHSYVDQMSSCLSVSTHCSHVHTYAKKNTLLNSIIAHDLKKKFKCWYINEREHEYLHQTMMKANQSQ